MSKITAAPTYRTHLCFLFNVHPFLTLPNVGDLGAQFVPLVPHGTPFARYTKPELPITFPNTSVMEDCPYVCWTPNGGELPSHRLQVRTFALFSR